MNTVIAIQDHLSRAWDAYVAASAFAQSTGRVEDGIAAGSAWRRWLDLFMTQEQREYLGEDRRISA